MPSMVSVAKVLKASLSPSLNLFENAVITGSLKPFVDLPKTPTPVPNNGPKKSSDTIIDFSFALKYPSSTLVL